MSADDDLGYVYLPTSSATNDHYGGQRRGDNLFTDSLVCLDAKTGKRVWHYQTVHHDIWDDDNPSAPILVDIRVNGRAIKAVVQVTKQSFAYVFDRVTGRPVWPIEERSVPQSTVPGEKTSLTQPFPTKPPPFDRQQLSVDDLIDFTPELRAQAIEIAKQYVTGPLFTPPSLPDGPGQKKGTLQLPGTVGGADWTGAAFDPETGLLYVPSMTSPFLPALLKGNPEESNLLYGAAKTIIMGPQGLPLLKPPYGRVTAIDLNRGEHAWMVANGDGPRDHPLLAPLHLPPLGQAVRAAPLVTKTLLFVSEGDQINARTPPDGGGRKLRAFDKKTGQVLWETEFEAGTTGTLMTYLHKSKQYVVVAIGSTTHEPELVALSLP
jgi:quinoprotein glucose dehydrogenase